MKSVLSLSVFLIFYQSVGSVNHDELIVETTSGKVEGIKTLLADGKSVLEFLGVPFAQPPVGRLRFLPPLRIEPSKDVIRADQKSKSCIQVLSLITDFEEELMDFLPPLNETSEDCLYLNVWVPSPKPQDAPVMIWVHGGGYEFDSANVPKYDGKILASEGVILVSMNYRLSVFGFLAFDPEEVPGNMGLMDQALAMQWVQDNVASFGGDPKKVTIFGESAGAFSVAHHLVLPSSQGLFQRAVLQSGAHTNAGSYSDKKTALETAEKLINLIGCDLEHRLDIINCLRETDVKSLVEKAKAMKADTDKSIVFNPVVDGYYYPEEPVTLINSDQLHISINLLLGANEDDGLFLAMLAGPKVFGNISEETFVNGDVFLDYINFVIGTQNSDLAKFIRFLYTDYLGEDSPTTNWRRAVADFATDYYFMCSTARLADSAAENGNEVYLYQFNYKSSTNFGPSWVGTNHADDLAFVFGLPIAHKDKFREEEVDISKKFISHWTEFSKKGNPNSEGYIPWPRYSKDSKTYITLDVKDGIETGMRLQRCGFINYVLPKLLNP